MPEMGGIAEAQGRASAGDSWHLLRRVGFRFLCLYFLLYTFPFPIDAILAPLVEDREMVSNFVLETWDPAVRWVGRDVFHLSSEITIKPRGSGDTTWNYAQLVLLLSFSAIGTMIWSILDRRRPDHRTLGRWLGVVCSFYLAYVMFTYGFAKVFKAQFPMPDLDRLLKPVGELSPMGLVWLFMGISRPYTFFAGAGEVLGGLLLLFRRTRTLGALVTVGVMTNVVMLNYAYDVPVKLYSSHLLLMGVALLLVDTRRLIALFLLNREVPAADHSPLLRSPRGRVVEVVVKCAFGMFFLATQIHGGWEAERKWGDARPTPPFYGIYQVEEFIRDGEVVPALVSDETRWRDFVVSREGYATVRTTSGAFVPYIFEPDENGTSFDIATFRDREQKSTWTVTRSGPETLVFEGELGGSVFEVRLEARSLDEIPLTSRGYHWINEYPYHR